jgi:hypothetical protein
MYEPHADIKPFPLRALMFLALAGWALTWYGAKRQPAGSQGGVDLLLDILFSAPGKGHESVIHQLSAFMTGGHWMEVIGYCSMGFAAIMLLMWLVGASQAAAKAQPKQPKHKKLINEG